MDTKGEGGSERNWEIRIDIYAIDTMYKITEENLPYSTGKHTEYSVMT